MTAAGDGWPGDDSQTGGDRQAGDAARGSGNNQPGDRQATHRIVGSPTNLAIANPDSQAGDEPAGGWRLAVGDAIDGLRFVNQSPGSLLDQIDYAVDGAYSNRVEGPWRNANIIYARFVAVPGLALCYLIGWAFFTRLSRALTCGALLLFLLMILNAMPVTAWLIPDGADFTTWLP